MKHLTQGALQVFLTSQTIVREGWRHENILLSARGYVDAAQHHILSCVRCYREWQALFGRCEGGPMFHRHEELQRIYAPGELTDDTVEYDVRIGQWFLGNIVGTPTADPRCCPLCRVMTGFPRYRELDAAIRAEEAARRGR